MINDTGQHKSLMSRDEKPQEVHITPLDFESRKVKFLSHTLCRRCFCVEEIDHQVWQKPKQKFFLISNVCTFFMLFAGNSYRIVSRLPQTEQTAVQPAVGEADV